MRFFKEDEQYKYIYLADCCWTDTLSFLLSTKALKLHQRWLWAFSFVVVVEYEADLNARVCTKAEQEMTDIAFCPGAPQWAKCEWAQFSDVMPQWDVWGLMVWLNVTVIISPDLQFTVDSD